MNAISRRELIDSHTTDVSKTLFNSTDDLMLICAVTMRTSENFIRDKKRSLYASLLLFYANQNDAEIIKNLIEDPQGLCQLLNEGDKFFLDRGFRDANDVLESKGFAILIPVLKSRRNQLTTKEANQSRFMTKKNSRVHINSYKQFRT